MDIVIVGISAIGKIAYEYFMRDSPHKVVAFAINESYINGQQQTLFDLPIVSVENVEYKYDPNHIGAFVAFGSNKLNRNRIQMYDCIKKKGYSLVSYVSSKSFMWNNVEIGDNCFVLENNVLQPFTRIGNNVTLWSGNHIGHESVIKSNCFISSHVVISGLCTVNENCFIGVNSSVADNITIAKDNFIALGSVINKNTEENKVYRGNPAIAVKVSAKRFCEVKE